MRKLIILGLSTCLASLLGSEVAAAQGCMPMRIASQVLGSQGDVYLPRGTWQVGVAYRRSGSNRNIQDHEVRTGAALPIVASNAMNLGLAYAVTDRLSLTLNLPFSSSSQSRIWPDSVRHANTSSGIGEISFIASYWLRQAQAVRPGGNVALGVGVKAPGKNDVMGSWWKRDGSTIPFPVHPTIQRGDGGWGIILQAQAFQPVLSRIYLYAAGSYTLSTRDTTDVLRAPLPAVDTIHYGVPDIWDARAGAAMTLWPEKGLSVSLGVRFNGTPRYDVLGGKSMGFRHPANIGYADPGVALTRGRHTVTLNVPITIYTNYRRSYYELVRGRQFGGGLPSHMILASYSLRFGL